MKQKNRLDVLLVEKGFFPSREKAKRSIMAGLVFVGNEKIDKAGTIVDSTKEIVVKGKAIPYVSRGGLKLEKAMKQFPISLKDKVAMDVGASTGGFTDCMLMNGAKKVYSVDVGYGQLDWKLRQDDRVVVMERTNIRYINKELVDKLEFASIDVSFISLKLVLPVVKSLLKENGEIVCLIKPQFEAGREKVGKKGVVRDINVHREVIEKIISFSIQENLSVKGLAFSPIKGPEGNIEYLAYLRNCKNESVENLEELIESIVNESHNILNKR
ncbi:MAG: TlyA family RNA methyltransferase [Anaeromicrobium sp.]|jgi:23S rRNA (cytidine1920-2'-O)/16S rRNA (cytidine1409-2'-O)-methyltransferase|uniref:TlyA family RNA methyltransferase n=1 Tax=Anaeromicrobium sp. TaxID=1929132 RepID=UPI0025E3F876|nr:TlyA family RNA methyltransferase [Anaeromicrobium sp.]MCT4596183.1 TlyA family RNA methyltransferase [Anaeromicrobium sp.]